MWGETPTKKELVNVGGRPIIWHVMRIFSTYGYNRFILTLGYQADQLKQYFLDYETSSRDFTVHLGLNHSAPALDFHDDVHHPPWDVVLADTGLYTEKASRIAKVKQHLDGHRFFIAYGDDVSDVDLSALVKFHQEHGKMATITAVQIQLPYGVVEANDAGLVHGFIERPTLPYWINGGFMLFENDTLNLMVDGDDISLEQQILPELARQGQLMIFRHHGFWQSMNTMKDNILLEELWRSDAPWKVW